MADGRTPLHAACRAGNAEGAALLLVFGGNRSLVDKQRLTPKAVSKGEACVQVLDTWKDNPMYKAISILRSLFPILERATSLNGDSVSEIFEDLYTECTEKKFNRDRITTLTRDFNMALSFCTSPLSKEEESLIKSLHLFCNDEIPINSLEAAIVSAYAVALHNDKVILDLQKESEVPQKTDKKKEKKESTTEKEKEKKDKKTEKEKDTSIESENKKEKEISPSPLLQALPLPLSPTHIPVVPSNYVPLSFSDPSPRGKGNSPALKGAPSAQCVSFSDAAWNGDLATIRGMLGHPDAKQFVNSYNAKGQTALYCACYRGHVDLVIELLNDPRIQIDLCDTRHGSTALHAACYTGNAECAALLLTAGARIQITNNLGLNARQEARDSVYHIFHAWNKLPYVAIAELRVTYPRIGAICQPATSLGYLLEQLRKACDNPTAPQADTLSIYTIMVKMNQALSFSVAHVNRFAPLMTVLTNYNEQLIPLAELQAFLSTFHYKDDGVQKGLSIRRIRASTSLRVSPVGSREGSRERGNSGNELSKSWSKGELAPKGEQRGRLDGRGRERREEKEVTEEEAVMALALTWKMKPPKGWRKNDSFFTQSVPQNSPKWKSFCTFFQNVLEFETLTVSNIETIYNPQGVQDFLSFQNKIKKRQEENPSLFSSKDWKLNSDTARREEVMNSYNDYAKQFYWNEDANELPVVPILHGTDYETAMRICNTGFTTLASVDEGWYGQGMYFSSSSVYNLPYFAKKETPCLIMCYAILGNVYPVTEDPRSKESLLGKPVKKGYHSHYVVTNKDGLIWKQSTRTPRGSDQKKQYREFVLFHEAQVLPAYVVTIGKDESLSELFQKYKKKEVPLTLSSQGNGNSDSTNEPDAGAKLIDEGFGLKIPEKKDKECSLASSTASSSAVSSPLASPSAEDAKKLSRVLSDTTSPRIKKGRTTSSSRETSRESRTKSHRSSGRTIKHHHTDATGRNSGRKFSRSDEVKNFSIQSSLSDPELPSIPREEKLSDMKSFLSNPELPSLDSERSLLFGSEEGQSEASEPQMIGEVRRKDSISSQSSLSTSCPPDTILSSSSGPVTRAIPLSKNPSHGGFHISSSPSQGGFHAAISSSPSQGSFHAVPSSSPSQNGVYQMSPQASGLPQEYGTHPPPSSLYPQQYNGDENTAEYSGSEAEKNQESQDKTQDGQGLEEGQEWTEHEATQFYGYQQPFFSPPSFPPFTHPHQVNPFASGHLGHPVHPGYPGHHQVNPFASTVNPGHPGHHQVNPFASGTISINSFASGHSVSPFASAHPINPFTNGPRLSPAGSNPFTSTHPLSPSLATPAPSQDTSFVPHSIDVTPTTSLSECLISKGLQKHEQKFAELGFTMLQDLRELTSEDDVRELGTTLGLNFVEQKKLRNLVFSLQ
eukprot:TRINITY_DN3062_c0_g1_i1.p1 TRINITY_DN3062_c0_g1~~TRINITY_DN3062_c0_g1_i1.p1  ORF type:complete len:1478 (+),score=338.90 TRINITY_DN3062_c0_g1_i1:234-4436(+)